jgi:hypothetical protein
MRLGFAARIPDRRIPVETSIFPVMRARRKGDLSDRTLPGADGTNSPHPALLKMTTRRFAQPDPAGSSLAR